MYYTKLLYAHSSFPVSLLEGPVSPDLTTRIPHYQSPSGCTRVNYAVEKRRYYHKTAAVWGQDVFLHEKNSKRTQPGLVNADRYLALFARGLLGRKRIICIWSSLMSCIEREISNRLDYKE